MNISYRQLQCLWDYKILAYIIGGSLLYSIGLNLFIMPTGLYNGGFLGLSQLIVWGIDTLTGLTLSQSNAIGTVYFLLNVPLLYISLQKFGGDFIIKTIFCVICYSVLLSMVPIPDHTVLLMMMKSKKSKLPCMV